jgi:predicted amidohydrolase
MSSQSTGTAMSVLAVQTGPVTGDVAASAAAAAALATSDSDAADLIVFPELYTRSFWCVGHSEPARFDWAEGTDGPTVRSAAELARRTGATVVAPFFERGRVDGEYYNSAAVIGPDGRLVPGRLPDGTRVATYRKNAISAYRWSDQVNDEKYYFRPGPGFAVFDTAKARLGILICLDRWFPEAWRVLALAGAEVICVANASATAVGDLFEASMRTCAAQNVVFVVAVNKVGRETFGDTAVDYYGRSCIVDPWGEVVASAGDDDAACVVGARIDTAVITRARRERTMYRDRRPELYGPIVAVNQ